MCEALQDCIHKACIAQIPQAASLETPKNSLCQNFCIMLKETEFMAKDQDMKCI